MTYEVMQIWNDICFTVKLIQGYIYYTAATE